MENNISYNNKRSRIISVNARLPFPTDISAESVYAELAGRNDRVNKWNCVNTGRRKTDVDSDQPDLNSRDIWDTFIGLRENRRSRTREFISARLLY